MLQMKLEKPGFPVRESGTERNPIMDNAPSAETNRRHFTPEQKIAILRAHLLEQVPISQLCDQHQINPTLFYRWQKELFENGAAAFAKPHSVSKDQHTITQLQDKLRRKDEVIVELMTEHIVLKKSLGQS